MKFESAIWLIRQYGQNIPQSQALCAVTSTFQCGNQTFDGQYRIVNISMTVSTINNTVGMPNPAIASLKLPALMSFYLGVYDGSGKTVANKSMSLLEYIKPLKNITMIHIRTDPTIAVIPTDFTDFPYLTSVTLNGNPGLTAIPPNFLNNSVRLQTIALYQPIESITIDTLSYFPSLIAYSVTSNCTGGPQCKFHLTTQSFPVLTGFQVHSIAGSVSNVNFDICYSPANTTSIYCGIQTATCNFVFGCPSYLNYLTILGPSSTISPPVSASVYSGLRYFKFAYSGLTSVPVSTYPPLIQYFVPPSLLLLNLPYNNLVNFDVDTILANNNGLNRLDFTNNLNFVGPITNSYFSILNSNLIVTNAGKVTIYGNNIGFGQVSTPQYKITAIIPNIQLLIDFKQPVPFYPTPTNISLGGVDIGQIIAEQSCPHTILFMSMKIYNSFFVHDVTINAVPCVTLTNGTVADELICTLPPLTAGTHTLYMTNGHFSESVEFDFETTYPVVNAVTRLPAPQGTNITLTGNFGANLNGPYVNLTTISSSTACTVLSITLSTIVCETSIPIAHELVTVYVTVDGYTSPAFYITLNNICQQSTNNCTGNGLCDMNGQCICTSNAFYNNCSKPYPIISSASYDSTNNKLVSLNGDFGPFGQVNPTIKINNTLDCTVNYKSQWVLNCTLDQSPNYGLSSVYLQVDSLNTTARNILVLRPPNNGGGSTTTTTTTTTSGGPSLTPQEQCEKDTFNCYGHGKCDINGICQCDDNYNPDDNCFTKFTNTTIKPNTTDPTVSFDIDGIDFQFEIVSIQELDLDGNTILKELFISNYSWNVNVSSNNIITIVNYQLNTTTNSSSSPPSSFQSVLVSSTISFSTQSRDIQFGDQTLHINRNSIKLAVNITNWQYSSNLATLRVVFRTIINNNQSVEYDCQDKNVEPLTYDSLSSLQYLRVVKDDVQFNGRFIDFALSDGRPTYSQTQLISLTQLLDGGDDEQSIAMIGINFPQCNECVLDPDFSPLLIDKSECGEGQSNTWRIIVGAVVGGVGAVAIAVASFLTYKKLMKAKNYDQSISHKLKNIENN
ncbi:hypothetical protein DFA_02901 [Cavenderia fasciculata]|uniref:ComC supersandwich domain-containing protein n=1 Tax=Cavenderia fasciculata TaxID=261658 RepID=F4PIS8_CACFS|nr:uncharacterized protein DFA_02901 [Cavenderia fasciculata]EGG24657.1 hypothetical protein DFA_02901 [Cavenderia fasciculata]|eukprot:XP_004362508.1 hypothetical protein DFA_02901 [Cavenderia fasciculata]